MVDLGTKRAACATDLRCSRLQPTLLSLTTYAAIAYNLRSFGWKNKPIFPKSLAPFDGIPCRPHTFLTPSLKTPSHNRLIHIHDSI